jgi:hypothetical protein
MKEKDEISRKRRKSRRKMEKNEGDGIETNL